MDLEGIEWDFPDSILVELVSMKVLATSYPSLNKLQLKIQFQEFGMVAYVFSPLHSFFYQYLTKECFQDIEIVRVKIFHHRFQVN